MTTYRLMDGLSGRPGNLTGAIVAFSPLFEAAIVFEVTSDNMWFQGYWWWVPTTGLPVAAGQKFLLWQWGGSALHSAIVPGSAVTAGALTAGQWNFVPLATPIALSNKAQFIACTVYQPLGGSGFFWVPNQFGNTNPFAGGITNGPLKGFSDTTGTSAAYNGLNQGVFATPASLDPAADAVPTSANSSANFGIDVQVIDQAPAGASYRMFPGVRIPAGFQSTASIFGTYTLATEFILSQACKLNQIRFYVAGDATALPTRCGIWSVASHLVVSGTDNQAPAWLTESGGAGAAGADDTLHVDYTGSGVVLAPGSYKVAVFKSDPGNTIHWFADQLNWWNGVGAYPQAVGATGVSSGPITAPNQATAEGAAQGPYNNTGWAYPLTEDLASNYWIDIDITPVSGSGLLMASFP
jgi:hypothetical protein